MIREKPSETEYNEYYRVYVSQVPEGDVIQILEQQKTRLEQLILSIPPEKVDYRYGAEKWTTREVVGHMLDTEWVFAYRAMRIARGDKTPLSGMDQDDLLQGANFSDRSMTAIASEYVHLRSAVLELFKSFDNEILLRSGMASGFPFTVRALMFILAGHVEHHIRVLQEKYL